jgi:hypothetical protein
MARVQEQALAPVPVAAPVPAQARLQGLVSAMALSAWNS